METLRWLGLDWDEGPSVGGPHEPYVQSLRLNIYQDHATRLLGEEKAYRCYCSTERLEEVRRVQQAQKQPPKYDRHCRELSARDRQAAEAGGAAPVVRFKTPLEGETTTEDVMRGSVTFKNDTLDDFVLLKSDGYPTYHLASIVDDHIMEISHVLRGEEWLSSSPRHVLLYQAFGWQPPLFAHLSRVLGPDRGKLSKRHGAHAALEYRDQGYLPEALINFMALLGWSLDDHTDMIDRDTLVQHFDLDRVLANPAMFNADKLTWLNGVYIRDLPPEELAAGVRPFLEKAIGVVDETTLLKIIPLVRERIKLLTEIVEMADFFFKDDLEYEVETLLGKRFADAPPAAHEALQAVLERVEGLPLWEHEVIEAPVRGLAEELGLKAGDLFGLVRVAITGKTAAPPLFETMEVLGQARTVARLRRAVGRLHEG